jgi:hypothetical protein
MPVRPLRERVIAMNQPSVAQNEVTTESTQIGGLANSCVTVVDSLAPAKVYGDFDSAETFELWIEAELAALELQFATFQTQRSTVGSLGR